MQTNYFLRSIFFSLTAEKWSVLAWNSPETQCALLTLNRNRWKVKWKQIDFSRWIRRVFNTVNTLTDLEKINKRFFIHFKKIDFFFLSSTFVYLWFCMSLVALPIVPSNFRTEQFVTLLVVHTRFSKKSISWNVFDLRKKNTNKTTEDEQCHLICFCALVVCHRVKRDTNFTVQKKIQMWTRRWKELLPLFSCLFKSTFYSIDKFEFGGWKFPWRLDLRFD